MMNDNKYCFNCGLTFGSINPTQLTCQCKREPKKDELVEAVQELTKAVQEINDTLNVINSNIRY